MKVLVPIILSIGWAIASVATMTYGVHLNWPDFVHLNYGFPLTFATHTLSTIAGPVDDWSVDFGALTADMSFWLLGMIVILVVSSYLQTRVKSREVRTPPRQTVPLGLAPK